MGYYVDEVMADSPRAYWKLSEASGSPQDSSGNGFHLNMVGGPTYGAGGIPGTPGLSSIDFGTTNGWYCNLGSLPALLQLTTYTLEAWWRAADAASTKTSLITTNFTSSRVRYALGRDNVAPMQGGFYDGAWRRKQDSSNPTAGAWHHFVTTYDGSTVRLYRNGSEITPGVSYVGTPSNGTDLYLARGWDTTNSVRGRLAHAAIYAGALSAARIAAHYTSGTTPPARTSIQGFIGV